MGHSGSQGQSVCTLKSRLPKLSLAVSFCLLFGGGPRGCSWLLPCSCSPSTPPDAGPSEMFLLGCFQHPAEDLAFAASNNSLPLPDELPPGTSSLELCLQAAAQRGYTAFIVEELGHRCYGLTARQVAPLARNQLSLACVQGQLQSNSPNGLPCKGGVDFYCGDIPGEQPGAPGPGAVLVEGRNVSSPAGHVYLVAPGGHWRAWPGHHLRGLAMAYEVELDPSNPATSTPAHLADFSRRRLSLAWCKSLCTLSKLCLGVSYHRPSGRCQLKLLGCEAAGPGLCVAEPSGEWDHYDLIDARLPALTPSFRKAYAAKGFDLAVVEGGTEGDCLARCHALPSCKAAVYLPPPGPPAGSGDSSSSAAATPSVCRLQSTSCVDQPWADFEGLGLPFCEAVGEGAAVVLAPRVRQALGGTLPLDYLCTSRRGLGGQTRLAQLPGVSAEQCARLCSADDMCHGFQHILGLLSVPGADNGAGPPTYQPPNDPTGGRLGLCTMWQGPFPLAFDSSPQTGAGASSADAAVGAGQEVSGAGSAASAAGLSPYNLISHACLKLASLGQPVVSRTRPVDPSWSDLFQLPPRVQTTLQYASAGWSPGGYTRRSLFKDCTNITESRCQVMCEADLQCEAIVMFANRTCQLRAGLWQASLSNAAPGPDPAITYMHIKATARMMAAPYVLTRFVFSLAGGSLQPLPLPLDQAAWLGDWRCPSPLSAHPLRFSMAGGAFETPLALPAWFNSGKATCQERLDVLQQLAQAQVPIPSVALRDAEDKHQTERDANSSLSSAAGAYVGTASLPIELLPLQFTHCNQEEGLDYFDCAGWCFPSLDMLNTLTSQFSLDAYRPATNTTYLFSPRTVSWAEASAACAAAAPGAKLAALGGPGDWAWLQANLLQLLPRDVLRGPFAGGLLGQNQCSLQAYGVWVGALGAEALAELQEVKDPACLPAGIAGNSSVDSRSTTGGCPAMWLPSGCVNGGTNSNGGNCSWSGLACDSQAVRLPYVCQLLGWAAQAPPSASTLPGPHAAGPSIDPTSGPKPAAPSYPEDSTMALPPNSSPAPPPGSEGYESDGGGHTSSSSSSLGVIAGSAAAGGAALLACAVMAAVLLRRRGDHADVFRGEPRKAPAAGPSNRTAGTSEDQPQPDLVAICTSEVVTEGRGSTNTSGDSVAVPLGSGLDPCLMSGIKAPLPASGYCPTTPGSWTEFTSTATGAGTAPSATISSGIVTWPSSLAAQTTSSLGVGPGSCSTRTPSLVVCGAATQTLDAGATALCAPRHSSLATILDRKRQGQQDVSAPHRLSSRDNGRESSVSSAPDSPAPFSAVRPAFRPGWTAPGLWAALQAHQSSLAGGSSQSPHGRRPPTNFQPLQRVPSSRAMGSDAGQGRAGGSWDADRPGQPEDAAVEEEGAASGDQAAPQAFQHLRRLATTAAAKVLKSGLLGEADPPAEGGRSLAGSPQQPTALDAASSSAVHISLPNADEDHAPEQPSHRPQLQAKLDPGSSIITPSAPLTITAVAALPSSKGGVSSSTTAEGSRRSDVPLGLVLGRDVVLDEPACVLGRGHSGVVQRGLYHGNPVAVKLVHPALLADLEDACHAGYGDPVAAMAREVRLMSRLDHPHIVRVLGAGLDGSRQHEVFVVAELMPGGSLEQLIRGHAARGELLPLPQVLRLAADIAAGLAAVHNCAVHHDVKPSNVLLDGNARAKLGDFGLSRSKYASRASTSCSRVEGGTMAYMAPECFVSEERRGRLGAAVDVYAWAVTTWQMLSGQEPWAGMDHVFMINAVVVQGLRPSMDGLGAGRCPKPLAELIARCWAADPRARPTAAEVLQALHGIMADLGPVHGTAGYHG